MSPNKIISLVLIAEYPDVETWEIIYRSSSGGKSSFRLPISPELLEDSQFDFWGLCRSFLNDIESEKGEP